MRDEVEPDTSVLLRHRAAEQPERGHLPKYVLRECLTTIALARSRRDLLVREILRELADGLLLGREIEVRAIEVRDDRGGGSPSMPRARRAAEHRTSRRPRARRAAPRPHCPRP